jgi:N-acetylneuraminic acid mutarotase
MKKKHTAQSGSLNLQLVLCSAAVCSMITGTLLAFFHPETPAKSSHPAGAGLTFSERVAYQRAIEQVYWRHRIWPSERPDPKPSLDAVMSQAQIESKVEHYLRNSQALEDYWQRPITTEQLQAEMDRMAQHTNQPEVLREIFEALRNDPFLIAECLGRPVLTERLILDFSAQGKRIRFDSTRTKELRSVSMGTKITKGVYTLPQISEGNPPCTDDTWTATSTADAPFPRAGHTAVWTGGEMIVWGGYSGFPVWNTGGKYNLITDSWMATTTINAPSARFSHTAVWTGSEMIIWGGGTGAPTLSNTGGRYNPGSDSWTVTSTINAPAPREYHTAVWTGSEMIVFGGWNGTTYFNTGGRYNPSTDSWRATNTINAPDQREEHSAVWTGSEMIVWGGYSFDGTEHWLNTGARYDAATDSWTPTSITNAPTGRRRHTAVWTGKEMVVWGGYDGSSDVNSGGRYDPSTNSWTATSTTSAPFARDFHTAVWTNSEMIVWAGCPNCNYGIRATYAAESVAAPSPTPSEPPPTATPTPTPTIPPVPGTGGRYDPATDTWRASSTADAPVERDGHTAVWTGSEMIVWGGEAPGSFFDTGGRYCAQSGAPSPTATPGFTPTPTATATTTATATATPNSTPRPPPTPRPHFTPAPRP